MFERINHFFENRQQQGAAAPDGYEDKHVAAAALLVEAARKDGHFDAAEHEAIERLLTSHFKLPKDQSDALLAVAERRERMVMNNWIFYEHIKRGFSESDRRAIVGDLWSLAYSDKALHRFESALIETIAQHIDVTATACAQERDRAKLRVGA
jgi:uncharacterized tellurite resistance protein B-like protein